MSKASTVSPFSVQTRQERQARWLEWQQRSVDPVAAELCVNEAHSTIRENQEMEPLTPYIPHRRYDSVVQRIQKAKQQTGTYTVWS